ncbi:MAG: helix-turn-helix domain-containing protein [Chloroflexi bacterium]|nr:helix-turn-helix domain-containing protein [Chloroflexota bacterium]
MTGLELVARQHPATASEEERAQTCALDALLEQEDTLAVHDTSGVSCEIPDAARQVIHQAVHMLAQGHAVALIPMDTMLTSQEAADILNVSRTYLLRLLNEGRLPCTKTGSHRRLRWDDVMTYKEQRDAGRRAARQEMVQLTYEAGLYDE